MTRIKSDVAVTAVFDSISEALKKGHRVEIRGFGVFEVRSYQGYKGRNPSNGEIIEVPEKRQAFFKVGKNLKFQIDGKRP